MEETESILKESKTIAVVGLSDKPERPSHQVASYLLKAGYKIIPVNPNIESWKGIKAYPSLGDVPEKIDVVDIFRRSEYVEDIVKEAIEVGARAVWMQLGVINEKAAELARKSGLKVVMDRCMMTEHIKLCEKV